MNIHEDKQWARIKKDLEYLTHWSFGTDSYYVEVEPYIDTALMIAIGIIIEEETTTERERPGITGKMCEGARNFLTKNKGICIMSNKPFSFYRCSSKLIPINFRFREPLQGCPSASGGQRLPINCSRARQR